MGAAAGETTGDGLGAAPLDGIRILDLTRLLPGIYATQLLGALGADVIKIEDPLSGDFLRHVPPAIGGASCYFLALGGNRRTLALDTQADRGREVLLRCVEHADVLLESFRPGVLERQGLGPDALRERNPRLVVCAVNGFGSSGPYRDRAAHDLNYQGLAGSLDPGLWPAGAPQPSGVLAADMSGGLFTVISVLAALRTRDRDGAGQAAEVSLFGSVANLTAMTAAKALALGADFEPGEYSLSGQDPAYDVYRTKDDRFVAFGGVEPKFWQAFCHAVDRPELFDLRWDHSRWVECKAQLTTLFAERTRDEWAALGAAADCCLTPILSANEAVQSEQFAAHELIEDNQGPDGSATRQLTFPAHFSRTPARARRPAPAVGAHTDEVLRELGFDAEEIAALRQEKVIR